MSRPAFQIPAPEDIDDALREAGEEVLKLVADTVMTFPESTLCPFCEGEAEWRCRDDGEFCWRLFCCDCGAELDSGNGMGLL